MSAYIVCWIAQERLENGGVEVNEHYEIFCSGTTQENRELAEMKYNNLVKEEKKVVGQDQIGVQDIWSVNMCKVVKSTDYDTKTNKIKEHGY